MKKIVSLSAVILGVTPMLVFAVGQNAFGLITIFNMLLSWVIPVLVTLAVVYFIWGIVQYMVNASDEEAKKAGRQKIINGLIGLFVIIAFWGIIRLVTNTFLVGPDVTPPLACVPGPGVICP